MTPSNLTSAAAGEHVHDLRTSASRARMVAFVRGCRESLLERTARRLHLSRWSGQPCSL
jgi:hypothetical protein